MSQGRYRGYVTGTQRRKRSQRKLSDQEDQLEVELQGSLTGEEGLNRQRGGKHREQSAGTRIQRGCAFCPSELSLLCEDLKGQTCNFLQI